MIIGVTGSQTWKDREKISEALDQAYHDFGNPASPNIVIIGSAKGADALCMLEAAHRGWHPATLPALWGYYGKRAGFVRDNAMVYLGMNASCWLAFINPCVKCEGKPLHDSHGTAMTMKAARTAGIEVREHR